jgi:hypothetical protein
MRFILLLALITSMGWAAPVSMTARSHHLKVERAALGRPFLLRLSLIPQQGAPTSEGTLSRVVSFELRDGAVYLMEQSQGNVPTAGTPTNIILGRFPILRREGGSLVLDTTEGFGHIFTESQWFSSDSQPKLYDALTHSSAVPTENAYVLSHELVPDARSGEDGLAFSLVTQVRLEGLAPSYEARIQLSPYAPDPHFTARENNNSRFYHYFETAPRLEGGSGRNIAPMTRWSLTSGRPIPYAISANTPVEFRRAVEEGILYWNKAAGREIVTAQVAPEGAIQSRRRSGPPPRPGPSPLHAEGRRRHGWVLGAHPLPRRHRRPGGPAFPGHRAQRGGP